MKICKRDGCGYVATERIEQFCPDCGDPLVEQATELQAEAPLETPAMPDENVDTRPVLFTVVAPGKKDIHLREGDQFRAASERTTEPVDLKLADDEHPGVSSQPLVFKVENGELRVTGGGTNGYKKTTVESFRAEDATSVAKGQTIVAGAKTPFRVK